LRNLDIGRLQVAMGDALFVGSRERARDLLSEIEHFLQTEARSRRSFSAGQPLAQRVALDKFKDETSNAFALYDAMNGRNIWMVERGNDTRLPFETHQAICFRDERS
jgi:hypothetical protein